MQDRYAGDVGDFLKFVLLRELCTGGDGPELRLGVCWYLVPDESHNADGRHVSYLRPGNRHGASLEACDPELFSTLRTLVEKGERSVWSLERSGVLPRGTVTYRAPLRRSMAPTARQAWHRAALDRLAVAELIFADPDNGVRVERRSGSAEKYAMAHELADYLQRGQSVVVYHHADRSRGGVAAQIHRRMEELRSCTGVEPLGGVIARRGSVRFFVILPTSTHSARLRRAVHGYAVRCFPHVEYRNFATQTPRPVPAIETSI